MFLRPTDETGFFDCIYSQPLQIAHPEVPHICVTQTIKQKQEKKKLEQDNVNNSPCNSEKLVGIQHPQNTENTALNARNLTR